MLGGRFRLAGGCGFAGRNGPPNGISCGASGKLTKPLMFHVKHRIRKGALLVLPAARW
jgi:hypothetical protein